MLKIVIPAREFYNEKTNEFVYTKPQEIALEHSLISISKWESKWQKPFLDEKNKKTTEEFIDYIRCMTLKDYPNDVFDNLTHENIYEVEKYTNDSQTATWFAQDDDVLPSHKIITSEVIYSWMVQNDIPFLPCEKWHLNRLLTLIRVCAQQNIPAKKMSEQAILSQNKSLNEARRAALHTRG